MIDKVMDAVDKYFLSAGSTDKYSYLAVKTVIDTFLANGVRNLETNIISVDETKGVAVFIWREGKSSINHWEFVYIKEDGEKDS